MSKTTFFSAVSLCSLLFASCMQTPAPAPAVQEVPKPDMVKIKAEIQAEENAWAAADNARDAKAVAAFYADDATSMPNNQAMLVGKAAILKDIETSLAKRKEGNTLAFETLDVYGDDKMITEVGTTVAKDASGKEVYRGKYMAIWEKRNGKWLTIRDMANDDAKAN